MNEFAKRNNRNENFQFFILITMSLPAEMPLLRNQVIRPDLQQLVVHLQSVLRFFPPTKHINLA